MPTAPDGDCDSDGVKNRVDADDDNDLLADTLELNLLLDPCPATPMDGVEDGYEYQSATDLNNDDYQELTAHPVPGKTPYPNPLFKRRRQRLRRRQPDAGRGVHALEVHLRRQPFGDADPVPAVVLRRRAVLALDAS